MSFMWAPLTLLRRLRSGLLSWSSASCKRLVRTWGRAISAKWRAYNIPIGEIGRLHLPTDCGSSRYVPRYRWERFLSFGRSISLPLHSRDSEYLGGCSQQGFGFSANFAKTAPSCVVNHVCRSRRTNETSGRIR